ncbi:MAG: adenylate/guanylate cyclase domain-containing protein [Methylococcales bacterium]|nr:adenylate/guanylate cyclase domain-containing protein [Methylococcales bacterium]
MNVCIKTSKACLSALLIGIFGAILCLTKVGLYFEEELGLAWLFKLRGSITSPKDVIIVNIDKTSAETLLLPEDPEKWPRSYYARLIEKLNRQNPAIIAFNIYFDEDRDPEEDAMLAKAIAEGKNKILSSYLKQYTIQPVGSFNEIRYERIIDPIYILDHAALGTAPFPLPKTSSTVKQFWTYKKSAGDIPTFPATVFQSYVFKKAYPEILQLLHQIDPALESILPETFEQLAIEFKAIEITQKIHTAFATKTESLTQLDNLLTAARYSPEKTRLLQSWFSLLKSTDSLYFNHYGKVGTITTIPFYQALVNDILNPELFNNKVILVGYSENIEPEKNQGLYTEFSSDNGETISSTEIAATAVANLIDNSWLRPLPLQKQFFLVLAWSFLLHGVCRLFSYRFAISLIIALSAGYLAFAYFRFTTAYVWFPLFVPIMLQTPFVLIVASISHFLKNKKDHQNMTKAFSFYLPDTVVSKIAHQPALDAMNCYGELMQGVCMATDAGQYTTLSETMDPLALNNLMNQYYGVMFPQVKKHSGIISDVIGDAMLAIWAAPLVETQHRINACHAALAIKMAIDQFNRSQPHQLPTRLGLHYGEMRVGNVGAMEHYEYRAVGDIVNTATRIEGLNKLLGTYILVSASVIEGLTTFFTREMGVFILKGKTFPVIIFELIAPIDHVEPYRIPLVNAFSKALKLFQSYQWPKALEAFLAIKNEYPEDGPTCFYISYLSQQLSFLPEKHADEHPALIEIGNITSLLHF